MKNKPSIISTIRIVVLKPQLISIMIICKVVADVTPTFEYNADILGSYTVAK